MNHDELIAQVVNQQLSHTSRIGSGKSTLAAQKMVWWHECNRPDNEMVIHRLLRKPIQVQPVDFADKNLPYIDLRGELKHTKEK